MRTLLLMMLAGGCASTPSTRPTGDCAGTEATAIRIDRTEPYVHTVQRQRGDADREIRGARVWIHAQPGLTREWLAHSLACHPEKLAGETPASISVETDGDSFRVDVVNADQGKQILAHVNKTE